MKDGTFSSDGAIVDARRDELRVEPALNIASGALVRDKAWTTGIGGEARAAA